MSATTVIGAAAGAALGLAVALALSPGALPRRIIGVDAARKLLRTARRSQLPARHERVRVIAWIVGGIAAAGITGWPVAGVAISATGIWLPWLLGSADVAEHRISVLAALGTWCRRMSDLLVGGGAPGLTAAVMAAAEAAPSEIERPVRRLAADLQLPQADRVAAFGAFADGVGDRSGDAVAAALALALAHQTPGVALVLRQLATSLEREVRARREVEADRAEARQSIAMLLLIQAGVFVLVALAPGFAETYRSFGGQLIMAALLAGSVSVLIWMRRIALGAPAPRFFGAER